MAQTVSNVVIAGPVLVYVATAGEAAPAASIAKGTAWGGNWVEVGFTSGGVELQVETEKFAVETDQYNAPVKDFITKQEATFKFQALEATLTNLKQAMGYGTITSGSTESTLGVSAQDGIPTAYAFGFEGFAPGATSSASYYRRIIIWNGSPQQPGALSHTKDGVVTVEYNVRALAYPSATASERLFKVIDRVV